MEQVINLPFTTSHAFIIGINDYEHITRLKTAVNDAKGLAERLEAQHGYTIHGPLLNPSKEELQKLFLEIIPNKVSPEDRVVFYFAGHGIALDGEEGPNGYIVPADARQGDKDSLVSMDLLHNSLNDLPCQHGMIILDCCFSGAFKWSTGYRDVVFDLPKVIYEERFWRYVKDPAWQVITSSAYDQKAVDVISNQSIGMREEGENMHSPFAKALFEALAGAGDVIPADQGDGVITASELYAYLRDSVESQTEEQSKRQSPSMFNLSRHDKGEFIFLNPRHRFNLPPTPDRNPFMGLASYDEADSNFFFGRDRVSEALVEKVKNNALTVVSGASGTGKSSVIKAGLLPILRKEGWELLPVIRPGKEPMQVLKEELPDLSELLSPETKLLSIQKELDALMTNSSIPQKSENSDKKYLLIIDQYEELISQCLKEEDRIAFEKQLAEWLKTYPQLHIILSVRSDFEPQFESKALSTWWKDGRYIVPSFSQQEIREVITKPALQAILFYEPIELVDKLEAEVAQAPGVLPLLSFTLSELYYAYLKSGRQDRSLSLEDYEKMGGVIGALRTKADEVYLGKDDLHKSSMRKLMLRMVSLEGGELAGKRVYVDKLIFTDTEETQRIKTLANKLVDARLILRDKDQQDRIYLEPAHDALVRAWGRLWKWIKKVGEEKLIWQNKLSQAVGDYHELLEKESPKAGDLLWNRNPRLDILKKELDLKSHNLNQKEETFVRKSVALRVKKRRQLIYRLIGFIAIVTGLGIFSTIQWIEAKFENTRNNSWLYALQGEKLAENRDYSHAYSLAQYGFEIQANENTSNALNSITTFPANELIISHFLPYNLSVYAPDFTYSWDGTHFAIIDDDSIEVWQSNPPKFLSVIENPLKGGRISFSPKNDFLFAFKPKDNETHAWHLNDAKSYDLSLWSNQTLELLSKAVDIKEIKGDYRILYAWKNDFYVFSLKALLGKAQDPQEKIDSLFIEDSPWVIHFLPTRNETFKNEVASLSPDGGYIYLWDKNDYKIVQYDLQTGKKTGSSLSHEFSMKALRFPKGGQYLKAFDGEDFYVWNKDLSQLVAKFQIDFANYFSPNARQAVEITSNAGRVVKTFDLPEDSFIKPLFKKPKGSFDWFAISPKESFLAYNIQDSSWVKGLIPDKTPVYLSKNGFGESSSFSFSKNETYLLERKEDSDGRIRFDVYDLSNVKRLYSLEGIAAATFSADNKHIITAETSGKILLRDINNSQEIQTIFDSEGIYERISISPSGRFLALAKGGRSGSGDKATIWDFKLTEKRELMNVYESIAFSSDETWVLGESHSDKNIHILETLTGKLIKKIGKNSTGMPYQWPSNSKELQMITTDNNKYLMTSSGVYDIVSGLNIESFQKEGSVHMALDPQGRFQWRNFKGNIRKSPILIRDWLDNKIHKYTKLD